MTWHTCLSREIGKRRRSLMLESISPREFLLLPGSFPIDPVFALAWSLSYEIFFYWNMTER